MITILSENFNNILSKVGSKIEKAELFGQNTGHTDDKGLAKNYAKGCANNDFVIPLTDATGLKKHVTKLYYCRISFLLDRINIDLL